MRGICRSFAGIAALRGVTLELARGEVLALVGENGAGKSTLIKVLGGALAPDGGSIWLDGREVLFGTPAAAQRAGIAIIYQEFNLIGGLSVRENIFLGSEPTRWGFVRASAERRAARELLRTVGSTVDPDARCSELTVAQRQQVEIAKALSHEARIVVMDEPTAALSGQEAEQLFEVIRGLKARGLGVIYVSHRLEEIFGIADRVMVLRDGQRVGSFAIDELNLGRTLESEFPKRQVAIGAERLRVEDLTGGGVVRGVSFRVRGGEVLGFAGLTGAGRTETMRLIFGADRPERGRVFVDGEEVSFRSPRDAIGRGLCLLPEDRKEQGLIVKHTVLENFGLPNLRQFVRGPFLSRRRERAAYERFAVNLAIKSAGPAQIAATLSGGNQQKLVLAKWLAGSADILIFDEPTRGVDIGAKYEIHALINRLASEGKAIIMVSSELPELLGMCDRILVMHGGRIRGEITDVASATQEDVLAFSMD
jgi:ABC-type sugar transport system ATPase subunit